MLIEAYLTIDEQEAQIAVNVYICTYSIRVCACILTVHVRALKEWCWHGSRRQ